MTRSPSRRRRRGFLVAMVATAGVVVIAGGALLVTKRGATASSARVLGPRAATVRIDIEHSRFRPARVRVRPHTEVRFVLANHDPIGHELIVGDDKVHARHADGTEAEHPPRPGEVSIAPGATASTTFMFHEDGAVLYACHLPGHFEFGMKGRVIVEIE